MCILSVREVFVEHFYAGTKELKVLLGYYPHISNIYNTFVYVYVYSLNPECFRSARDALFKFKMVSTLKYIFKQLYFYIESKNSTNKNRTSILYGMLFTSLRREKFKRSKYSILTV